MKVNKLLLRKEFELLLLCFFFFNISLIKTLTLYFFFLISFSLIGFEHNDKIENECF